MKYFILPLMVLFLCVSFSVEGQRASSDSYETTTNRRKPRTTQRRSTRTKRSARSARSARSGKERSTRRRSRRSRAGASDAAEEKTVDTSAPRSGRRPRSARSGRGGTSSAASSSTTGRRSRRSTSEATSTAPRSARSARRARGVSRGSSVSSQVRPMNRSGSVSTAPLTVSETPAAMPIMAAPTVADMATTSQMYAQPEQETDKEEQLLTMEAGKERFRTCMDDFCNDTDSINPAGRCLCSANIAKLKPLEDSVHQKMKQLFQMTSNVEAAKLGMQYELFNESVLEKMGIEEDEEEENPWDIDNIDYGLDALLNMDAKRKEGLALFKDAMSACKPYLDATASFKKYIVDAYEASAQKSCRGYENSLTDKLRRYDLAMQATYNKIQKTEQKTTNAYNASKCSQKLHACMVEEAKCGEDFSECSTRERLEERKLYCKGETLDKCQDVAETVWEEFVKNAVRIGTGSIDEQSATCARDLKACFEEGDYCGENNIDCATAEIMKDKKALCYDSISPCHERADSIWDAFVTTMVTKGSATKAALDAKERAEQQRIAAEKRKQELAEEKQAYQKCARDLQRCATSKCGSNAKNCRTDAMAENIRGLCASTLIPCEGKADSIWSAFKKAIVSKGAAHQKQIDNKNASQAKVTKCNTEKQNFQSCVKARCGSNWGTTCGTHIKTCATTHFKGSCESHVKDDLIASHKNRIKKCAPGYQNIGGQCRKALISPPAPKKCSPGYEFKYGRCMKKYVAPKKCPSGYVLRSGKCVRSYYPSQYIKYGRPGAMPYAM